MARSPIRRAVSGVCSADCTAPTAQPQLSSRTQLRNPHLPGSRKRFAKTALCPGSLCLTRKRRTLRQGTSPFSFNHGGPVRRSVQRCRPRDLHFKFAVSDCGCLSMT